MSEFGSETSRRTVRHYAGRAEAFWEGTRDHDVTQNRQALIRHLHGDGPHHILILDAARGGTYARFQRPDMRSLVWMGARRSVTWRETTRVVTFFIKIFWPLI